MAGRALLDTSVIVELLRGDASVAEKVGNLDEIFTSVVVIGELLYGARHSANSEANLRLVSDFASAVTALPSDRMTAEAYARLKQGLRAKGRPIPDNDLWVAASAVPAWIDPPLARRPFRRDRGVEARVAVVLASIS